MKPLIWLLAALVGGRGLLGAIFFGGLWWTVRKGLSSPRSRRFGSSAACCCG
jgi:F1F0 ATPase subunit 2